MKKWSLALVVLFGLTGFIVAKEMKLNRTALLLQNLNKIENLYFPYLKGDEYKQAVDLLNQTRKLIVDEMDKPGPEQEKVDRNILTDEGFNSLYNSTKREFRDADKSNIILAMGKNGKLTCLQLSKLLKLYTFDSDKVYLMKKIADHIIDPVNISVVLNTIDNSIIKEEMARFFQNR